MTCSTWNRSGSVGQEVEGEEEEEKEEDERKVEEFQVHIDIDMTEEGGSVGKERYARWQLNKRKQGKIEEGPGKRGKQGGGRRDASGTQKDGSNFAEGPVRAPRPRAPAETISRHVNTEGKREKERGLHHASSPVSRAPLNAMLDCSCQRSEWECKRTPALVETIRSNPSRPSNRPGLRHRRIGT